MSGEAARGWPLMRLSHIADLSLGKMLDKEKNKGELRPYLANTNVRWGSFDFQDLREMRFEARELERYGLKFGDIVMCEGGEPGRCALWTENVPGMMIQKALHRIRPMEGIDSHYLYFALAHEGATGAFDEYMTGGGIKHLPGAQLAKVEVPVPPLDEQRRIAEVLRSVDEAIAANEAALWQRDRIRKGFSSLFHCGLGHSEFQMSCIGEIPASWQVKTMKDVCHNVGVGIASSATHAYAEQGVPLLRNQNIKPGHLDLDDLLFVNEDYDRSYASKRVRTGDIITMRTGYPGRSAVIPPELAGCQTFTTLISRPKLAVVDPLFLCEWINSEPGMVEIRKRQAGGAQQNLNAGAMEQVPVPLPPMEEQRQIASILRNFPTEDDALIAKLRRVRKLMQADLLSGRVRVPA